LACSDGCQDGFDFLETPFDFLLHLVF
jgi:hypothetical protein